MKDDDLFWLWLSLRLGPNNATFLKLFQYIGKPYDIFRAESDILDRIPDIKEETKIALANKSLSDAQNILTWCREHRVALCRYGENTYPTRLMSLKRPPLILYVQGHIPDLTKKLCVCVVGTRNCSEYGAHTAYKIAYELATAGAVIVSGMAKGIDGVAAAGTLAAGGYTIAVLGCGLDVVYPKVHAGLMREIIKRGAVVTEYPPFAEPNGKHFPVRNRIISGLSDGALIVEAPSHSGAMITADHANEQGRVIYAMPGNVDSKKSDGPNRLIRDGANVVLEGHDVLQPFLSRYQNYLTPEKIRKIGDKSEYRPSVFKKLRMPDYAELAKKQEQRTAVAEPEESSGLAEAFLTPQTYEESAVPVTSGTSNSGVNSGKSTVRKSPGKKSAVAKNQPLPEEPAEKNTKLSADDSAAILATMSECCQKIFADLPIDKMFSTDQIMALGYPAAEILPALTMLTVKGLIRALPGGLYQRN